MEKNMFETVDPKVDFPKLDKEIFQWWEDEGIPKKYRERNQDSVKRYSFIKLDNFYINV